MAIGADAVILFAGDQTELSSSQTEITNTSFQALGVNYTNSDDAPLAAFVLACRFTTTMPAAGIGTLDLYARPLSIQSTNNAPVPGANFRHFYAGSFPIPYSVAPDTIFYTFIPAGTVPWFKTSQVNTLYLHNNATGQSITTGWQMWITPLTQGPHA